MDKKRKILIATGDATLRDALTEQIKKNIPAAVFVSAVEGNEAMFKIQNDPPNIVFLDPMLAKVPGAKIVEWLLGDKAEANLTALQSVAAVMMQEIPEEELFIDAIVTGRVQILPDPRDPAKLRAALEKALGFIKSGEQKGYSMRSLEKHEVLMREGDKADFVYILRTGRMKAVVIRGNKEDLLGYIEAGEFVGEMAYVDGEPRSATVKAMEPCELIAIPIDSLDHVLFRKPAWAKALMRTLTKRIKASNTKNHFTKRFSQ